MKYIITEQQHNKIIDKFISFQFEPHDVEKSPKYPNLLFWTKNGERIVARNTENKSVWIDPIIWETITSMFDMDGDESSQAIVKWLDDHYGFGDIDIYTS